MTAEEFKYEYLPYQQRMYRVAFRILENSSDAEDMVQEAFIKLWDKREELSLISNKGGYCATLVKNLCIDYLRTAANRLNPRQTDIESIQENIQVSAQIEVNNEIEYIERLINLLPEQQKQVITLKHYEGYSTEEIERQTGLTAGNIRVLLSRSRKRLKELFTEKRI